MANHESCKSKLTDSCFLAGMLHGIGKLVLLAKLHKQYDAAAKLATGQQVANAIYYEINPGHIIGKAYKLDSIYLVNLGFTDILDEWCGFCTELLQINDS